VVCQCTHRKPLTGLLLLVVIIEAARPTKSTCRA
jgi:hypothetical protein